MPAQCGAELRLIPGPTQEQDEFLRDRHGDPVPMVFFDQREGQIDSRSDAGRRPEASILNEDALIDDLGRWYVRGATGVMAPFPFGSACSRT